MADWRRDFGTALAGAAVCVKADEMLAEHTTFGIGGPVDLWVEVNDIDALRKVLRFCQISGVEWWLLGRGSNVLVSDQGLRGMVIKLGAGFSTIGVQGETVRAGAAAMLDDIAETAARAGLCGAEFLAGIPGTVGGGLQTNAGAFGRSLADILERVTVMDWGKVQELGRKELKKGYRKAVTPAGMVVTEVVLRLGKSDSRQLIAENQNIRGKRCTKQPSEPSAGSFFRNPENIAAGRIIEQCGLKGERIGGARVSEKHANFIVNSGGASFADVYELVQIIKACVEEKTGIELGEEVQVLPRWENGKRR